MKNLKLFDLVVVSWNDAWGSDTSCMQVEDAKNYIKRDYPCKTIGFVLEADEKAVTLHNTIGLLNSNNPVLSTLIHIPTPCITKIDKLKLSNGKKLKV